MDDKFVIKIFLCALSIIVLTSSSTNAFYQGECKCVAAVGSATNNDYNLLLKVRDPSREGYQVLSIVEPGYEYDYHHPWTGFKMHFVTKHRFLFVATKGDVIPNITKPGIALSDSGIAYADADSPLIFINPSPYAWDDFDWMRYSCQEANDEKEAIRLLTEEVVGRMHAPGLGENLFIVGPNKAFLIEADAFHYDIAEIDGVAVQSNYPKRLWKYSLNPLLIGSRFNSTYDGLVREGKTVRLGFCLIGVFVEEIGPNWIIARQIPFEYREGKIRIGKTVTINKGESKTVGYFRVKLLECEGNKARISMCYKYLEWESRMMGYVAEYRPMTVRDMMNLSRLHSRDLGGLRGMCEGGYEAGVICKIYREYPSISALWFAPNPCSSIYIPAHVCAVSIYHPYESGEAHQIASKLLKIYGHGNLTATFNGAEGVILKENEKMEKVAIKLIEMGENYSEILTLSDEAMQLHGFSTQLIWLDMANISNLITEDVRGEFDSLATAIGNAWIGNYSLSFEGINEAISAIMEFEKNIVNEPNSTRIEENLTHIINKFVNIASNASLTKIVEGEKILGEEALIPAREEYEEGMRLIKEGNYEEGINRLKSAFDYADDLIEKWLNGIVGEIGVSELSEIEKIESIFPTTVPIVFPILMLATIFARRKK